MARYSYGWQNPNHAAAVLVCIIPLFWALESLVRHKPAFASWRYALWLGELLISAMLGLTYSRGGGVAWLASLFFYGIVCVPYLEDGRFKWILRWRFWLPRLAVLTAIFFATGLTRRFLIIETGDASAGNRLKLWRGGLELVAVSPLAGWGRGNSGNAYMQWVQDPNQTTLYYNGMVNSYLHIAVEFGLIGFVLFLTVLLFPIILGIRPGTSVSRTALSYGAAAGLVGFAVANIFSTLWIFPDIIWMPIILMLGIYFIGRQKALSTWIRALIITGVSAGLMGSFLYGAAVLSARDAPWHLHRTSDGALLFSTRDQTGGKVDCTFLPDGRVLGDFYGKEIRRAVVNLNRRINSFVIYPPGVLPKRLTDCVLAFGSRYRDLSTTSEPRAVGVVFPVGAPPAKNDRTRPEWVALPEYDEIGYVALWRQWCIHCGTQIYLVNGAGQDARGRFGLLLENFLEHSAQ